MKYTLNSQSHSHTHWLSTQSRPQPQASQRVCLPSPEKEIFKNAPRATKKRTKKMKRTDKYELHNRLTMWTEKQKE